VHAPHRYRRSRSSRTRRSILDRVGQLVQEQQLQHAIDLLDDAVAQGTNNADVGRQLQMDLATTLYLAEEHSRAAAILDAVLPTLNDSDSDFAELYYYAGVSHAEIGETVPAIEHLNRFVGMADSRDTLYRDAVYQLGMLLAAEGRVEEGLRHLQSLRPVLVGEYGPQSVHVATLDRRISQIRQRSTDVL
jgi:tetratricopeptide (TPR) repeat protein